MRRTLIAPLLGLGVAIALPAGAAPAGAGGRAVQVRLSEHRIAAVPTSVAHGKVTFVVRNVGTEEHEMVVVRTSKDAATLLNKKGRADEKGSRGEVELGPGTTQRLTLTLPAGHYVLLCNVGSHYRLGMHRNFTVS
jgi:uncharacterized cupredoxin-like copper-binding protein